MSQDNQIKDMLATLTDEQLDALRQALNPAGSGEGPAGSGQGSPLLSQEQIRSLKAEADQYRRAQKQVAEAVGVLWNARLDMAMNLGRSNEIQFALVQPVEFYDNCNCGGGGGGPACW